MKSAYLVRFSWMSILIGVGLLLAGSTSAFAIKEYQSGVKWPVPKVVTPGNDKKAPSDAIVLFNGKDLSQWNDAKWQIQKDGTLLAKANKNKDPSVMRDCISTKQSFGDCQLHVEWASPKVIEGKAQGRGNSGVFLMGLYEVQILDSYKNETNADGQAGSIYKQHPPMVNVCRKPGEWQTFDIIFRAPQFDKKGKLLKPAVVTVFHNGVLIQDHFELPGETAWHKPPEYIAHPPKLPLRLQYHRDAVKYRNIWIREL